MFAWGFSSHSRIFHSNRDVTITDEESFLTMFVCVFAWGFSSHSRISPSYPDVTISDEGLQILTYKWSAPTAIEQWGLFSVPYLLWHGASFYNYHLCDTRTYCQAFGSAAVTTCFYDPGLSRLGFELPTFRLRGERSNELRHCCG